jgi:outer membrane protein insertion porin family
MGVVSGGGQGLAQGVDPEGRPIAEVRLEGRGDVPEALVRNQIRLRAGEPYQAEVVNADIGRLTRIGRFSEVRATVEQNVDGSVVLTYVLSEQPTILSLSYVGNNAIETIDLMTRVVLRPGDPIDPFLIERAKQQITAAYREEGYFIAEVSVDEEKLKDRVLEFRIREGPRVTVRDIRFEGNILFSDAELRKEVKQEVYLPILKKGNLNRELLQLDEARVRDYLRARGYLDAQADARIDVSPDQKDAIVTFTVYEGPQYIVEDLRFENRKEGEPLKFPAEQLQLAMQLRPGAVFSEDKRRNSEDAVRDLYGKLGYLETKVTTDRLFAEGRPRVTLVITIDQGVPSTVGKVIVRGNELTQTKVILRETRGLTPGRVFDRTGLDETQRRLNESPLFRESTVTVLGEPGEAQRDVLIDVKERNTGSISFGASVSSDLGLGGAIDVTQRNFDITDTPDSFGDLISGKAFRGAGQNFKLTLAPGVDNSSYAVNWSDSAFLESDYSLDVGLSYAMRDRRQYDEDRGAVQLGVGRRFGDVWRGSVRGRFNSVDISGIESDAPVDVFDVEGGNTVTGLGFTLRRATTDSFIYPSRGSVAEVGVERVGVGGGDFDFTKLDGGITQYWTVDEDFLGRKTIVMGKVEAGYILEDDEAPVFERYYAGGRTFRGFRFRGVGPRGIRSDTLTVGDDAVGGQWSLLTTLQYEFPLVDDYLRAVVFTDQGTVSNDIGVDDWRISVGAGIRMRIDILSQIPFAIDFAVPLVKQDGDETEIISFTLDIPFQ